MNARRRLLILAVFASAEAHGAIFLEGITNLSVTYHSEFMGQLDGWQPRNFEIPCNEIKALAESTAALSAVRSSAIQMEANAAKINNFAGAKEAAARARAAAVRMLANEALEEVIGAHRIVISRAILTPDSDALKFIMGQSTWGFAKIKFPDFKVRYLNLESKHKIVTRGPDEKEITFEKMIGPVVGSDEYIWMGWNVPQAVSVPHIKLSVGDGRRGFSTGDLSTKPCGLQDERACGLFDLESLYVDLPVSRFCDLTDDMRHLEILRFTSEYTISALEPEPFRVTQIVGINLRPTDDELDVENSNLDRLLKKFIISILGQDQSYRVSDAALLPMVPSSDSGRYIVMLRNALNVVNDALASSPHPVSDATLTPYFSGRNGRYSGIGGGVVEFALNTGSNTIGIAFSRDQERIYVARVTLDKKGLYP